MKRLAALGAGVVLWLQFVERTERWGTLPHEPTLPMPGDELISAPALDATRVIVIDATPEEIYPWFAQMGPGRAGWYSYDRVDNAGVESARAIHPEWVITESGMSMGEMAGIEFVAADARPGRHLVIALANRSALSFTLAYLLEPWGGNATRVIVRVRGASNRSRWLDPVIRLLLGPGDFVMLRRQLLGVKERAERR